MWLWLLSFALLAGTPAWASSTIETTKAVNASALTSQMKVLVPALEGLDVDQEKQPGTTLLTIRRLSGEFSPAEAALLAQALAAHDAAARSPNPDLELDSAISGATTLEELKSALLGKTKSGKVAGRTP